MNKNVKELVKKEIVDVLVEEHKYSVLVAEKATLLSGNKNVEESLKWIEEHKGD